MRCHKADHSRKIPMVRGLSSSPGYRLERAAVQPARGSGGALSGPSNAAIAVVAVPVWAISLRQLTITSMAPEVALLRVFAGSFNEDTVLVSYNDKSRDAPLLSARYRLARLQNPLQDLDLLHPVRRRWKVRMENNCKLATAAVIGCGDRGRFTSVRSTCCMDRVSARWLCSQPAPGCSAQRARSKKSRGNFAPLGDNVSNVDDHFLRCHQRWPSERCRLVKFVPMTFAPRTMEQSEFSLTTRRHHHGAESLRFELHSQSRT